MIIANNEASDQIWTLNDDATSEYHEDVSDEYEQQSPLFIHGTAVVVFKHSEARRGNNGGD